MTSRDPPRAHHRHGPAPAETLRRGIPELGDPTGVEVKVVSPVSDQSFGQWLANEEDSARAEAEQVAEQTADRLGGAVEDAGDTDPVQAAEDALREFPADELIVVLPSPRPGEGRDPSFIERESPGSFERLGLPVRYVAGLG